MMMCSALVFFMTPGLALFYSGFDRKNNSINLLKFQPLIQQLLYYLLHVLITIKNRRRMDTYCIYISDAGLFFMTLWMNFKVWLAKCFGDKSPAEML